MKKRHLSLLLIPFFAGCLFSSSPRAPEHWTICFEGGATNACAQAKHRGGTVRIDLIEVRAPYAGQRLAVLRPDGTIAFDAYNTFAKSPVSLIKGATYDLVTASGAFDRVITDMSSASSDYYLELYVTELALDCRTSGTCKARVSLVLTLIDGRNVVSSVRSTGEVEAGDDFSAAFSTAFANALGEALAK